MQRKNNFLRNRMQKSGFAMIMAITVIVIMATLMAVALSMSAKSTKSTVDLYVYEQALLLSKSAAEYALLKISQENNSTNPCEFTGANFKKDYYDVNISVKYIYTNFPTTCHDAQQYTTVTTPEQNGSVLMDITVAVHDANITSEPISYFRRTIQKL